MSVTIYIFILDQWCQTLLHRPIHRIFAFPSTPNKFNENMKSFWGISDVVQQ